MPQPPPATLPLFEGPEALPLFAEKAQRKPANDGPAPADVEEAPPEKKVLLARIEVTRAGGETRREILARGLLARFGPFGLSPQQAAALSHKLALRTAERKPEDVVAEGTTVPVSIDATSALLIAADLGVEVGEVKRLFPEIVEGLGESDVSETLALVAEVLAAGLTIVDALGVDVADLARQGITGVRRALLGLLKRRTARAEAKTTEEIAEEVVERAVTRGPKELTLRKTKDVDPDAEDLARRIGGEANVEIEGVSERAFDAVSDEFIGETTRSANALAGVTEQKARNFLGMKKKQQFRDILRVARETGRRALFEFRGPPHPYVRGFIERNAERMGVGFEIRSP